MKIIAYYLPQFHEVKENNIWWGEGFTEWTNVKAARPLYKQHIQPNLPLNNNFYDLTDVATIQWQTDLVNKYGVYGLCYYHYWFNGRKILEKPAEILLQNKQINQNFCFCWANHTWSKSWNGSWETLITQTYGEEEEWEQHFDYLLPFFEDVRYIKVNNKPMFVIFDSKAIPQLDERIQYYNKKCIENGFDGIYIVESLNNTQVNVASNYSSAITLREPTVALSNTSKLDKLIFNIKRNRRNKFLKPHRYLYKDVVKQSLEISSTYRCSKEIILGSFTGWDSTPRHKNRGYVIENNTSKKFKEYLLEQEKIINEKSFSEFVFLNAWNEWAEGMVLEPTQKDRYKYLETIAEVIKKCNPIE